MANGHYPIPKTGRNSKTGGNALRPHERRATGATTYYRLATWQPRSFTFRDNAHPYETPEAARAAARKPGRYLISEVSPEGVEVYEDFEV